MISCDIIYFDFNNCPIEIIQDCLLPNVFYCIDDDTFKTLINDRVDDYCNLYASKTIQRSSAWQFGIVYKL